MDEMQNYLILKQVTRLITIWPQTVNILDEFSMFIFYFLYAFSFHPFERVSVAVKVYSGDVRFESNAFRDFVQYFQTEQYLCHIVRRHKTSAAETM